MKITEENFIYNLKDKNEDALEYVIKTYGGLVSSIVKKHLYYLESFQEECVSDVFLGIWNNIESFDPSKNPFKNWVAGIARYKSIDYLRKYLKQRQNEPFENKEIPYEDSDLGKILEGELSQELQSMLDCLKPEDQAIFHKLFIEDKSIDAVSMETGLKSQVIYNRVSRGKRKIRNLFSTY